MFGFVVLFACKGNKNIYISIIIIIKNRTGYGLCGKLYNYLTSNLEHIFTTVKTKKKKAPGRQLENMLTQCF